MTLNQNQKSKEFLFTKQIYQLLQQRRPLVQPQLLEHRNLSRRKLQQPHLNTILLSLRKSCIVTLLLRFTLSLTTAMISPISPTTASCPLEASLEWPFKTDLRRGSMQTMERTAKMKTYSTRAPLSRITDLPRGVPTTKTCEDRR